MMGYTTLTQKNPIVDEKLHKVHYISHYHVEINGKLIYRLLSQYTSIPLFLRNNVLQMVLKQVEALFYFIN